MQDEGERKTRNRRCFEKSLPESKYIIGGAPMKFFDMMVAARARQLQQEKIGCVVRTNK